MRGEEDALAVQRKEPIVDDSVPTIAAEHGTFYWLIVNGGELVLVLWLFASLSYVFFPVGAYLAPGYTQSGAAPFPAISPLERQLMAMIIITSSSAEHCPFGALI